VVFVGCKTGTLELFIAALQTVAAIVLLLLLLLLVFIIMVLSVTFWAVVWHPPIPIMLRSTNPSSSSSSSSSQCAVFLRRRLLLLLLPVSRVQLRLACCAGVVGCPEVHQLGLVVGEVARQHAARHQPAWGGT
jgi:hypothetical protein